MKTKTYLLISVLTIAVLFGSAVGIEAQNKMMGKPMDMAKMMKSPHHMLMMAYTKTMADFSRMLRDQALTPNGPDVEFARASVAELRHNLDAMEALHQKQMAGMSGDMKEKMKMMMEKMDKDRAMVKEHVSALETAVRADKPDAKQIAMHANDLVKHFSMMMKPAAQKAGKKKMKMKM